MEVTFWKLGKRKNSTMQPTGAGTTISALYKDAVDLHNPTLQLKGFNTSHNYAKIGNIYYYVSAVQSVGNGLWEVSLQIDLLATYKADILNTTAFVVRASNSYNQYLIDDLNAITTKVNRTILQSESGDSFYETGDGCFILQTINSYGATNMSGLNVAYILTATQAHELASELLGVDSTVIEEFAKIFQSPINSVVRLMWMPLSYDVVALKAGGGASSKVYLGSYETDINAYTVTSNLVELSEEFNLADYIPNNYTRNSRFTEFLLCLPYIGTVAIDLKQLSESGIDKDDKVLTVRTCVDVRSGKLLTIVAKKSAPNAPINTFESVIATDCPLSSAVPDTSNILNNITALDNAPPTYTHSDVIGRAFASLVGDACRTVYSTVGTSGGNAFSGFGVNTRCIILKRDTAYTPLDNSVKAVVGFPCNKVLKLSDLNGGYVQTANASVSMDGYSNEVVTINQLLNGGVYIE